MMDETTKRARWHPSGLRTWLLKRRAQDGGEVLARIESAGDGYVWWLETSPAARYTCRSFYAAQRRARAALIDEARR